MPSSSGTSARRGSGARMGLAQAAALVDSSYLKSPAHAGLQSQIEKPLNKDDVQAFMLKDRTLLIPGSDSAADYLKFNLRLLNIGGKRYKVKSGATGNELGRVWHQGFLAHAMYVKTHFDAAPPKLIVGHSLGAASAQVLSLVWGVPAICFAAPRVYAGGQAVQNDKNCLCIHLADDPVGSLPSDRFRHAGKSLRLGRRTYIRFTHKMTHYKALLGNPNYKASLPTNWPVTG